MERDGGRALCREMACDVIFTLKPGGALARAGLILDDADDEVCRESGDECVTVLEDVTAVWLDAMLL
jgi:hypothetical protein